MATLLRINGTKEDLPFSKNKSENADRMRKLLQCDLLEVVHCRDAARTIMVVDEEGHCVSKPINTLASVIYGGLIAGDVVLVSKQEAPW